MSGIYGRKGCIAPGCEAPHCAKGMCKKHYYALQRNGDFEPRQRGGRGRKPLGPKPQCSVEGCEKISLTHKSNLCGTHLYRMNRFGSPLAPINHHAEKASAAERDVQQLFRAHGHTAHIIKRQGACDVLVDGKLKIEVKSAEIQTRSSSPAWVFNIHRHGILKEQADFYIFQFLGVPGQKGALYAAFKSPVGKYTVSLSLRAMIRTLAPAVALYESLVGLREIESEEAA